MQDLEFLVPEFEHHVRTPLWYVYFALIISIFITFSLLTRNYSFIAIVVLGAILIIMRNTRKPGIVMVAIHENGIYVQNKLYEYKDIKDFSIFEADNKSYLIFNAANRFQIPLRIPVDNPAVVRAKLNKFLTEVEYQESLIDIVIRLIGL